jgi:hypothetical protein
MRVHTGACAQEERHRPINIIVPIPSKLNIALELSYGTNFQYIFYVYLYLEALVQDTAHPKQQSMEPHW